MDGAWRLPGWLAWFHPDTLRCPEWSVSQRASVSRVEGLAGATQVRPKIAFAGYNPAPWDGKRRFPSCWSSARAPCRMLALFLAIALLGTDGAYGRSTTDLTGDNHDNTDLGGSELHAKAGAYYGGDGLSHDTTIDFTIDTTIDLAGAISEPLGLGPSRPSLLAPPASPSPGRGRGRGRGHWASMPSGSPSTPKVTDWHTTDWWRYGPVDGEITGSNPDNIFENPDNMLALELAGYAPDPLDVRTTDEKMAKASIRMRDDRFGHLVRDDPYWRSDDPRRFGDHPPAKAAIIGLTTSQPSPPTPPPSAASPPTSTPQFWPHLPLPLAIIRIYCAVGASVVFLALILAVADRVKAWGTPTVKKGSTVYPQVTVSYCATTKSPLLTV